MKNYSIIKKNYSKRSNIKEKYNIYKNGLNVGAGIRLWLKGGRGDQKCASWNLFDFRINYIYSAVVAKKNATFNC